MSTTKTYDQLSGLLRNVMALRLVLSSITEALSTKAHKRPNQIWRSIIEKFEQFSPPIVTRKPREIPKSWLRLADNNFTFFYGG